MTYYSEEQIKEMSDEELDAVLKDHDQLELKSLRWALYEAMVRSRREIVTEELHVGGDKDLIIWQANLASVLVGLMLRQRGNDIEEVTTTIEVNKGELLTVTSTVTKEQFEGGM